MTQELICGRARDREIMGLFIGGDRRVRLRARLAVHGPDIESARRKLALHGSHDQRRPALLRRHGRQVGADGREFRDRDRRPLHGRAWLPHRAGDRAVLLLQIEGVVDDASRKAEKGQKYEPCRCYAHREREPKSCPAERPSVPAILAAETKEMLNAGRGRFAASAAERLKPPRPRHLSPAPPPMSPGRPHGRMIVAVVPCPSVLSSTRRPP